jgi:hypothetical protein
LFDTTNCPNGSLMHLGLQVGDGWLLVIGRMCAQLQPLAEGGGVQILAVKQDMGTLRVAYRGGGLAGCWWVVVGHMRGMPTPELVS